jgi:predicted enzyme related to lactoylglutathione lyase
LTVGKDGKSLIPATVNTHRNPVGWFEIYVQDLARAQAFYEATFEVKLQELPSPGIKMLAFPMKPESPGCGGALVKFEEKSPGDGGTLVYFSCDDCAVEAARAAKHGGKIIKEKFSIGPYGYIALTCDSEGNLIGLHSRK